MSELQGACRKGSSCIHTALTLQETISKERESNDKVFVAYYDVSKAFDSVWIDGLFFQLHKVGIKHSLWRILYKMYLNFKCCVRIGQLSSSWYDMDCGIHQGGFLSLMKYTVFIDSLLRELEDSELCCSIYQVPSSPVGYADDLAACTRNKHRMDKVMDIVYQHSCKWRFSFNPGKSAILVYGDSVKENKEGSIYREFKLGKGKVKEKLHYDHVGIKSCVVRDTHVRTAEKVEKSKKALNMSTNMGIVRGGLNLKTCSIIYWSVVFPALTFGCEAWMIKNKDVELLQAFQRYSARRLQRLHSRSINSTCTACLGWMDIVRVIKAKKLIFIRTIAYMYEYIPLRRIFINRLNDFHGGHDNLFDSPVIQMLEFALEFNVLPIVKSMFNGVPVSKQSWKRTVWSRAWTLEKNEWDNRVTNDKYYDIIKRSTIGPGYSVWWSISDVDQRCMKQCETMVKLITHTSLLKDDDCRLKRLPYGSKMCTLCDLGALENANHMIMQCPRHDAHRIKMHNEINMNYELDVGELTFGVMMGQFLSNRVHDDMIILWKISSHCIYAMYKDVLTDRRGVG